MMLNKSLQQGISLVELMISMTLGLVLTLGIFSLFATSQRSYQTLRELTQMQENAYFAVNFLAEPLREAGFFQGCPAGIAMDGTVSGWNDFRQKPVTLNGSKLKIRSLDVANARSASRDTDPKTAVLSAAIPGLKKDDPVIMIANDCSAASLTTVAEDSNIVKVKLNSDVLDSSTLYPLRSQEFDVVRNVLTRNEGPLVTGVSGITFRAINHGSGRDAGVLRAQQYSSTFDEAAIGVEIRITMISESDLNDGEKLERTYTQTIAMRNRQVQ